MDGHTFYVSPVHFEHKECLDCHKDAKLHDVAAVIAVMYDTRH